MFTEDWYDDQACKNLADLAASTNHLDGQVVEVGCWEGKSTVAIANAVWPAELHAVDTWEGSPGEISADLAKDRDVHKQFLANVDELTAGNVIPIRMGWRDWFNDRHKMPVRFCHIDATHSYEEVRDNIAAVLPLLVDGGIICGDDIHHPPVREAVFDSIGRGVIRNGPSWYWKNTDLANDYRAACATPSDIYEHLPVFVATCWDLEAKTVIELGTRGGVSTLAWLYGLEQTDGHLWSVDIDPAPDLEHDRWTFLHGDDLSPEIFGQLPTADVVFIDTSHMFDQTAAELNLYRWKVRPGGKILLHDTELARPIGIGRNEPSFPVRRAAEQFCHDEGFTFTNRTNCYGLGIIEVT